MRTTLKSLAATLVVLALAGTAALAGGGDRVGTAGANQLLMPVGARGIALGSSFLAGISGVNAIYYNPAGLSASDARAEVSFSHYASVGDIGVDYLAIGTNFSGFGHLAFSIKSLSFGDIPVTSERAPDGTGGVYSPSFINLGLTYSRALTDRIRAGITFQLVSESIDRVTATGMAVDAGIQYQGLAGMRGLMLGVTLRHLGGNMAYDGPGLNRTAADGTSKRGDQILKIESAGFSLPTSLEIGMAYSVPMADVHNLTLAGAFENNNFLNDQYRIGVEYGFRNTFFLRGSYNIAGQDKLDVTKANAYIYGAAFGAGINYSAGDISLGVDYAYRVHEVFDGSHVFTLNIGF